MRGDLLKIPEKERSVFNNHFLSSVHCQLTMPSIEIAKILENKSTIFEELNFLNFSDIAEMHRGSFKIEGGPGNQPHLQSGKQQVVGLRFLAGAPKSELTVSNTSLLYSEFQYTGFENFSNNIEQIYELLAPMLDIDTITCVGFRKINSILVGPVNSIQDAISVFNPSLFGMARSGIAETQSIKAFDGSLVLQKNDYACMIKHSLRNLDENARFEVNLDFDLLDQKRRNNLELRPVLQNLNDTSFDLFSWAAGEKLIKIMSASPQQPLE